MHCNARARKIFIALIATSAVFIVAAQESALSVGQYVADALETSNNSIGDLCERTHPQLKAEFDRAMSTLRPRIRSMLKSLLETEQFKSLSQAQAPKELIDASANSAESIRSSSVKMSLGDCTKTVDDFGSMSDEVLRGELYQMLFYSKMFIDMHSNKRH